MLNFFKNLFGSGAADTHANGNGYAAAAPMPPVQSPAPVRPPVAAQRPVTAQRPITAQRPPASQPPAAPAPAPVYPARPVGDGNSVQIPLHTVIAVLPLELKTRIRQTRVADLFVTLSLEQVLSQLGSGLVKISFGELRDLVPDVFALQTDLDEMEVSIPLNEILPQINPALLARRQSQRQVEVPEDVQGPFGKDCAGVKFAEIRAAAPASTPAPAAPETNIPPARATRPVPPVRPAPVVPPAPPAAPAPAAEAPLIPFRHSLSSTPTPRPPAATPSVSPPGRPAFPSARGVGATPLPVATPRLPSAATNGNGNGNGRAAVPQAAPAAAAGPETFLNVPLAVLSESWPEVLRSEIEQLNLSEVQLALPVRVVEPALKQGKIAFPWKVLRSWVRPATLPTVSAHDGMMLELPLRVIAPLFIARQKQGGQVQQKVQINEKIPNLFFGFPQADSAPAVEPPAVKRPPQPVAPAPAPAEEMSAIFSPAAKSAGIPETNFYVWGENGEAPRVDETEFKRKPAVHTDFLSRYATPNEVVTQAAALAGVVGALVALPDGLMVASKLSPELNGDTLAAFLPQIFGKVSQCTRELRMGELNNLHFTVGNVPWKIFRVNAIFFAAFGNAGQPLPTAQLAALAGQLDRKK
jgi:predicted regulator of Ras-like GTPase activity (Roadblock/LC7/MglB family)